LPRVAGAGEGRALGDRGSFHEGLVSASTRGLYPLSRLREVVVALQRRSDTMPMCATDRDVGRSYTADVMVQWMDRQGYEGHSCHPALAIVGLSYIQRRDLFCTPAFTSLSSEKRAPLDRWTPH